MSVLPLYNAMQLRSFLESMTSYTDTILIGSRVDNSGYIREELYLVPHQRLLNRVIYPSDNDPIDTYYDIEEPKAYKQLTDSFKELISILDIEEWQDDLLWEVNLCLTPPLERPLPCVKAQAVPLYIKQKEYDNKTYPESEYDLLLFYHGTYYDAGEVDIHALNLTPSNTAQLLKRYKTGEEKFIAELYI